MDPVPGAVSPRPGRVPDEEERARRVTYCRQLATRLSKEWSEREAGVDFIEEKELRLAGNHKEALRLFPILDLAELARAAGYQHEVERAGRLPVGDLVRIVMDKVAKFSPGQLKKGFTALVKYKQWLAEQGIAKEEVLKVDFAQYLKHVEATAADMVARGEAERAAQRRVALEKGRPPEAFGKEHTRSGARAAGSAKEALIWVRIHMGVTCVPLNTSQHSTKRVAASVREYTPIAPACMAMIEKACTDPALSEEVKGSCAILVAIMSSSMRAASAARAKIPSTADLTGRRLV